MKKIFSILLLILLCSDLAAQQRDITGTVCSAADSTALAGVTLYVDRGTPNTITDNLGRFTLRHVPASADSLHIVLLGYRSMVMKLPRNASLGTIYLPEEQQEIETVTLNGEVPMAIQKGDTTQYNAAAFSVTPDADADRLIAKLPGATVENGTVEIEGEKVQKVYVDGREFFGDNVMTTLRTIPADAIESIQVYDEVSDHARLLGIDDGETQKVMNLITRHKRDKSIMYKIAGAGGANFSDPKKFRYLTGGNFSQFSKKSRITFTLQSNNVNVSRMEGNSSGEEELENAADSRGDNLSTSAGASYSYYTRELKFSANYLFQYGGNRLIRNSLTEYFPAEGRFDSKRVESDRLNLADSYSHSVQAKLEAQLSPSQTIVFTPQFSYNDRKGSTLSRSLTIQDADSLNRNSTDNTSRADNLSFRGNLTYYLRLSPNGRSLSASLGYNFSRNDSENYTRDHYRDNFDTASGEWRPASPNDRRTLQAGSQESYSARLTYNEPIAKGHNIQLNLSASHNGSNSDKSARSFDEATGDYTQPIERQSSIFDRNDTRASAGIGYNFHIDKWRLNVSGAFVHSSVERDETVPREITTRYISNTFQPSANLRYNLDRKKFLRFNYRGSASLPSLGNMQNIIDDSNPNNIRIGNPDLHDSYNHSASLTYNSTNIARSTRFSLGADFSTIAGYEASATEVLPSDRDTTIYINPADPSEEGFVPSVRGAFLTRYVNMDGYRKLGGRISYAFPIRPIKCNFSLSGGYNYTQVPSIYGEKDLTRTHSGNIRAALTSNISQYVDFTLSSRTSLSRTTSLRTRSLFLTQNLRADAALMTASGYILNLLASYTYYGNDSDISRNKLTLNASLGRKLFRNRRGEVSVGVYNILNRNDNITHNIRTNSIEDTQTNNIGRYVMGRFFYRFNSMSRGANRSQMPRQEQGMRQNGPGPDGGFGGGRGGMGPGGGFGGGRGGFGGR